MMTSEQSPGLARAPFVLLLALLVDPPSLRAQTVPADLLDIPMEDLFSANIVSSEDRDAQGKRWRISYRYGMSDFVEYYVGSNTRSYGDVLWTPGEARTRENYPVVPTEIRQEVHSVMIGYDISDDFSLRVVAPFIRQSSDHISIVPGYDEFNISSSGWGDVVALLDYSLERTVNSQWRVGIGLSAPTGSIDEQGDTPRAPGDQQLPYTMQIGSGTWDIPLALAYEQFNEGFRWGGDLRATWRSGQNDRDYRLGHKFMAGGWAILTGFNRFEPGMRLDYHRQGEIHGEDASLRVPNPAFPYPAPVADPNAFGGERLVWTAFVDVSLGGAWFSRLEYGQPLWMDLNGPQSGENYHFAITVGTDF